MMAIVLFRLAHGKGKVQGLDIDCSFGDGEWDYKCGEGVM